MDKLILRGIDVFAHGGVAGAEREIGHRFTVDVAMDLDVSRAAVSDDLADAVDIAAVYDTVVTALGEGEFRLLESMAARLAERLLDRFPVNAVTLRLAKPYPPLPGVVAEEAVEITRPAPS
ncbi:MAG TPA: dihydroneopterin aldolase [Chloroflexota bacterium]|nr:dihydroneopterin aldolase [Chloroflexota bacterium]